MKTWSLILVLSVQVAQADDATVAVAANFQPVLERLAEQYEKDTGHRLRISSGSTGKLYAQIVNGAPYDVLLAADRARPTRLGQQGLGIAESQFTYVIGRLALIGATDERLLDDAAATLAQGSVRAIAIANPALAPYGKAAREVLDALGVADHLRDRIVMGENVGQAYTLVATGNADLGLVALSLAMSAGADRYLPVSGDLHAPIRQDAILLAHGAGNPAATGFMAFLRDDPGARALIVAAGFGVD
jgi:molybdate transport system substrate-binding protein